MITNSDINESLVGKIVELVDEKRLCEMNFCADIAEPYRTEIKRMKVMGVSGRSGSSCWVSCVSEGKADESVFSEEDNLWTNEHPMTSEEMTCFRVVE